MTEAFDLSDEEMPTVRRWMTFDLWMALGHGVGIDSFEAEWERIGFADLWAALLVEVRTEQVRPVVERPHHRTQRTPEPSRLTTLLRGYAARAHDNSGYRAMVPEHVLSDAAEVIDDYRLALATPADATERCPVCGEPVADRWEHADGSDPTGHRAPAPVEP